MLVDVQRQLHSALVIGDEDNGSDGTWRWSKEEGMMEQGLHGGSASDVVAGYGVK
jgi:hypothetical protein